MKRLDLTELLSFLLAHEQPVSEPDLLRHFVPGSSDLMLNGPTAELYRAHFTLYHHLYRLSETLSDSKYRLFINLIYASIIEKPGEGICLEQNPSGSGFCGMPVSPGLHLCGTHYELDSRLKSEGALDFPDIAGFYLDPENYAVLESELLDRFTKEIYFYAAHHREVDESLSILGLSIDFTPERLRSRYRYLSMKYHPDVSPVPGPVPFSEITNAYSVLLRLRS